MRSPQFSFLGFCLLTDLSTSHLPLLFPILLASVPGDSTSPLHLQCGSQLLSCPSRLRDQGSLMPAQPHFLPSRSPASKGDPQMTSFCFLPLGLTGTTLLPGPPFLHTSSLTWAALTHLPKPVQCHLLQEIFSDPTQTRLQTPVLPLHYGGMTPWLCLPHYIIIICLCVQLRH